jgi:hypothetical protein
MGAAVVRIEIAVAMWGFWVDRWRALNFPVTRAEADDVGATLVVYTDGDGRERLASERIDEFRELPPHVGWFDQADGANADAINRALAGDYAVAPIVAALRLGRGTMAAAKRRLEMGYRACMALCIPCGVPETAETAAELSRRIGKAGVGWWENRVTSAHPGHYGWRSKNGATLVRPIYHHPVLIRPTKAHDPRRAVDHFMVEGYLDDISQVAQLDPLDGCIGGLPSNDEGVQSGPPRPSENPAMAEPRGIVDWMLSPVGGFAGGVNVMPWNLHYMAHRFWCGEPGADRLEVEVESDKAIAEIRRLYFERTSS